MPAAAPTPAIGRRRCPDSYAIGGDRHPRRRVATEPPARSRKPVCPRPCGRQLGVHGRAPPYSSRARTTWVHDAHPAQPPRGHDHTVEYDRRRRAPHVTPSATRYETGDRSAFRTSRRWPPVSGGLPRARSSTVHDRHRFPEAASRSVRRRVLLARLSRAWHATQVERRAMGCEARVEPRPRPPRGRPAEGSRMGSRPGLGARRA